ncbi:tRNA (adenosine(37)-N6)-threonylcarbamoyltransferase complex ATPase subunit type 1 TsaE [Streptococcus sp. zg-JUN1979]|uniref:tRNA (adenosine(37)-N6)-threonylcarbamoyltransferase complex ATPase subunit type 1 TsaE n=1 Tax=Streptococcus sp. zg-JUN1979 TaxID=3391450 RepID=UPI0039A71CB4
MLYSHDEATLRAYGQELSSYLRAGDIIVLTGDLGAGKTTLTKGIAKGLGVTQMVKSPTYTIAREYEGRLPLYHLDVYRIGDDPDSIDLEDFLYGDGVTIIEWGNLLSPDILGDYLEIVIDKTPDGRSLSFIAHGRRAEVLAEQMTDETD